MKKNYARPHKFILEKRLNEPRRFIQVISGPRQVGKTTLVQQVLKDSLISYHFASADAISQADLVWIESQWNLARLKQDQAGGGEFLLVIDEIQKVSNWSEAVKQAWDEDTRKARPLKVVLLGSSRLLLQQGLTESLAGRFEHIYMGHWAFSEMHTAFGLSAEEFVWFGGYPGSAPLMEDEPRWKAYIRDSLIEASISRDILMLTRIDKPALMRRLFELGCLYSGQIFSYTKMLGQLQDAGNTTTLAHYLRLLDTAGLLMGLERYRPHSLGTRSSSPKFQVHNPALMTAFEGADLATAMATPALWGRRVEVAVGAHLVQRALSQDYRVYYWREKNHEVDFVLERGTKVIGLEVKSGFRQRKTGLAAFKAKFNPHKVYVVGDTHLSWKEFLEMDPIALF